MPEAYLQCHSSFVSHKKGAKNSNHPNAVSKGTLLFATYPKQSSVRAHTSSSTAFAHMYTDADTNEMQCFQYKQHVTVAGPLVSLMLGPQWRF